MKPERALTLLCKIAVSNVVARMSALVLAALAAFHSLPAAAHDGAVPFHGGGAPVPAIEQKEQPVGVDRCAAQVASTELPTARDAPANAAPIRSSGGTIVSQVARVNASLLTSDRPGANTFGEQPPTKGLTRLAAPTQSVQRAVMFDEDRSDPKGKSYSGTVSWRVGIAASHRDAAVQPTIRAEVDVPDPGLYFVLCMAPNDDQSLSASHTIAVILAPTSGAPHGGIAELAGITMKRELPSPGVALLGIVSKVAENSFRLALSRTEFERRRNMKIMKEESWMGILLRYNDRLRAVIALEKGADVADALATWR
jgi:hypothetical protein